MELLKKINYRIKLTLAKVYRQRINGELKSRLVNSNFSIVSSNCCGAILLHDLGLPFNSPTVNLFFEAGDFVTLCEDLKNNFSVMPEFLYTSDEGYPVCSINGIKIYAMHYKSYSEFLEQWNRRVQRLNYDNLFIMMTDRDGFSIDLLDRLKKIPFPKVVFTHVEYPEYGFTCYLKCFSNENEVGDLFKYADYKGNRYYEKYFDIIGWLNRTSDKN